MRKLSQSIVLIFSFFGLKSFAQSTTILPSRIDVPNVAVLPTCDANGKGQMVYNTGDNKMYFCNGTVWKDMTVGGFSLPYSGSGSVVAPNILFNVSNSGNGRAITGETSSPTYGIGVYGASTNTTPSSANPSSIGVFGLNNSQNSNGIGIYGQHDGSGKGIYGVVKNSGIGVHGIGLPVSSGGNGFGIGVKGESTNNYGIFGISAGADAIYGTSTTADGVKGISSSLHGGHFETNSSTNPALYVLNNSNGPAAQFYGDVNISSDLRVNRITPTNTSLIVNSNAIVDGTLTVNNNKGVAYNLLSASNMKIAHFVTPEPDPFVLGAHESDTFTINLPSGFTSAPTVLVGSQYLTGGTTGELYRIILVIYNCTSTQCTGKVINTDNAPVSYFVRWNLIAIGN
jgi:hypothetical protein